MFVPQWLQQLSRYLFPRQPRKARNDRRQASDIRRVRLCLEGLEERLTPSTINPIGNSTPAVIGQADPSPAASTNLALTTVSIVPNLSNATVQLTLTAQVSNPANVVNEGVVSFRLAGVSGQGNVVNGTASAQLTLPLDDASIPAIVDLSYRDNATPASFANSSTSTVLSMNSWNALLPSNLTFDSSGNEQSQVDLAGAPFLGYSYTASGQLTQINFSSFSLPVTTTNVSGQTVVSIAGAPWQIDSDLSSAIVYLDGGEPVWLLFNSTNQFLGEAPYQGQIP